MINVKAQVLNPDDIKLKFEITFTLGEWKKIANDLSSSWLYPMSDLADSIRDCTRQAEQTFVPKAPIEQPGEKK